MRVHRLVSQEPVLAKFRELIAEFKQQRTAYRQRQKEMRRLEIEHAMKIKKELERGEGRPCLTADTRPKPGWEYLALRFQTEDGIETVRGWCPPEIVEHREESQKSSIDEESAPLPTKVAWLAALHDAQFRQAEPVISPRPDLGTEDFDPDLFIMPAVCTADHMTAERLRQLELFLVDVENEFTARGTHTETEPTTLPTQTAAAIDSPPDYSELIADEPDLARIIAEHHHEAVKCLKAGAYTASTVLLGSVLEGCLAYLVKKDMAKKDGKKASFNVESWSLCRLVEQAQTLSWFTTIPQEFARLMRLQRNVVHPYRKLKEDWHPSVQSCENSFDSLNHVIRQLAKLHEDEDDSEQA